MDYYLVQYKREVWLDTIMILVGDIHKHLVAIERLEAKYNQPYRLKRITEELAQQLTTQGYVAYRAPDQLNDDV